MKDIFLLVLFILQKEVFQGLLLSHYSTKCLYILAHYIFLEINEWAKDRREREKQTGENNEKHSMFILLSHFDVTFDDAIFDVMISYIAYICCFYYCGEGDK